MEKYLKALTLVFFILGAFGTLAGATVLIHFNSSLFAGSWIGEFIDDFRFQEAQALRKMIIYLPMLIASLGLHWRKKWGRIMGMIWSILNFADFPVGTVFGIFGLWVLLKKETKKIFKVDETKFI